MNGRYLLCRPTAGLNDILCQIELCCRYAERFGRTVIVQTDSPETEFFRDRFSNYFVSLQSRLLLSTDGLMAHLNGLETFPAFASGRLDDYRMRYDVPNERWVEAESGQPSTFDFDRDYDAPLLLHQGCGGGPLGIDALGRMRLHDTMTDALLERLRTIGLGYTGIHIRNTDYRARYRHALAEVAREAPGKVFVATDNRTSLEECREAFGADRVFSFARLPQVAGETLHFIRSAEDAYEFNRDAILDLMLLGLSDRVYAFALEENRVGAKYSGFSLLAIKLCEAKPVLSALIARPNPGTP